jgi:hypothetical protein
LEWLDERVTNKRIARKLKRDKEAEEDPQKTKKKFKVGLLVDSKDKESATSSRKYSSEDRQVRKEKQVQQMQCKTRSDNKNSNNEED